MSRDTLLDEAIAKAKDRKDWQMVEWLRTARSATASARWYTEKIQEVEAENAKLRELVRDMEAAFIHGPCYRWCEFKEPCNGDRCQYRDRMRELGVDA